MKYSCYQDSSLFEAGLFIRFEDGFYTGLKPNMQAFTADQSAGKVSGLTGSRFQELHSRWAWLIDITVLSRLSFVVKSGVINTCHDI